MQLTESGYIAVVNVGKGRGTVGGGQTDGAGQQQSELLPGDGGVQVHLTIQDPQLQRQGLIAAGPCAALQGGLLLIAGGEQHQLQRLTPGDGPVGTEGAVLIAGQNTGAGQGQHILRVPALRADVAVHGLQGGAGQTAFSVQRPGQLLGQRLNIAGLQRVGQSQCGEALLETPFSGGGHKGQVLVHSALKAFGLGGAPEAEGPGGGHGVADIVAGGLEHVGNLNPAVGLRPPIARISHSVSPQQLQVLLVDLLEGYILRGVDVLLQFSDQAALDHRSGEVGHQIILSGLGGGAEETAVVVGEQQLQPLGVDLGGVDVVRGVVPVGTVPVIVVVVAQLVDQSGKVVEAAGGLVEHKGGAIAVEHGGEPYALLAVAVGQVIHLVVHHIVQGLRQFAGHLADVGLDHVDGGVAGVVGGKDFVGGGQGHKGGQGIADRRDIDCYRPAEGQDLLLGVVPGVDRVVGVVAVVLIFCGCGDLLAQADHAQVDLAQGGVLGLNDLCQQTVGGLRVQAALGQGGVNGVLVIGPSLVVHRIASEGGQLVLLEQRLLLLGPGHFFTRHSLIGAVVVRVRLGELLAHPGAAGGGQKVPNQQGEGVRRLQVGAVGVGVLLHVGRVGGILVDQDVRQCIHGQQLHDLIGQRLEPLRHGLRLVLVGGQGADGVHLLQNRRRVDPAVFDLAESQLRMRLILKKVGLPGLRGHSPGA